MTDNQLILANQACILRALAEVQQIQIAHANPHVGILDSFVRAPKLWRERAEFTESYLREAARVSRVERELRT